MKKFLLLILALFTMTASAFAADSEPRFDNMRTALIVSTTQRGAEAQYMLKRLREPFRIPYWDRVEAQEQLAPDGITIDAMRALSENTTPTSSSFPSSRPGIGGSINSSSASTAKS